ncbi:MAG: CCA tRNA nucleotidyltransferase [Candidatus Methanomethylophilaceae archaeon]|nr:CCA tRNA nucleotidyltransferase [Candidatus Methanomethylophilaceae archaeon]
MTVDPSILERIIPSAEEKERINRVADEIREKACQELARRNLDAEVRLMGSVAKGTYLCDPDLDIFLLFPPDFPSSRLEEEGLAIGDAILKGEKMYADHPYIRGIYQGLEVDMVPCYDICDTSCLQSAVDRTPFHTRFILENLDEKMRDQARVLKAFMKGVGTYGAEPQTRGFSGYLIELLVWHYGSFQSVLEAASKWKEGLVLGDGIKNQSMQGPLVVYDPVDRRRNVASAVHVDTFALFITAARAYLRHPSSLFFFPVPRTPLTMDEVKQRMDGRGSRLLTVSFSRPCINHENLEAQMWKAEEGLAKVLESLGFHVLGSAHVVEDGLIFAFELEDDVLPPVRLHVGPPVWVSEAERFLHKWKEMGLDRPTIKNGRWQVMVARDPRDAVSLLQGEKERISLGQNMDVESMCVHGHQDSLQADMAVVLSRLLDRRYPWEIPEPQAE